MRRGTTAPVRLPRCFSSALSIAIGDPLPLERAAQAHDRLDAGSRHRVLLAIPD